MTKRRTRKTQSAKRRPKDSKVDVKIQEKMHDDWLDFSNNINERLMKLTKEGSKEYEQLYNLWSEYAQKMSQKLANFSPDDKKAFSEMQDMWTDYSDKIGGRFADILKKEDGPFRELYQLWSDYSGKMGVYLSELMSSSFKEQKELYELWMDAFGIKDKEGLENMPKALEGMNAFWQNLWQQSEDVLSSKEGKVDYAEKYKELNELWTKSYSKMMTDILRSQAFAELNSMMMDRNLEFRQLNEKAMNQYLSSMGLPTREGLDDIYKKLHELDRKISDISRKLRTDGSPKKK
jgi:hypothetical protein